MPRRSSNEFLDQSSSLCMRCGSLNIEDILDRHNSSAFDEEIPIYSWNDYDDPDWLKADCAFCQLVNVIKKPHDTAQAGLWFFTPSEYLYLLPNPKAPRPIALGLKREVRRSTTDNTSSTVWRDADGRTWRTWTLFVASRGSVHGQGQLLIREIDARQIDFGVLRDWLAQDGASPSRQRPPATPNIPARLIDCQSMTIVTAESQPYLALSYVWGKARFDSDGEDPGTEGGLPESLPSTIADAITLTTKLGYRYLWVDKYSIDQKDEVSKLHDIQNMDIIFQSADATLVAAAGQDAEYGLPGVDQRPRRPPFSARLGGFNFTIVSATFSLQDTISNSKWDSRKWTYQEAILAQRMLIFTEQEVYFESGRGNRRETVEVPFPQLDANIFISQKPLFDPWNAHNPENINAAIAEYSSRELSHQGDALIAALGFLKEFRNGPNPVYHHYGVPIFPDQAIGLGHGRTKFPYLGPKAAEPFSDQGFLLGLCWRPAGDHLSGDDEVVPQRCPELPSWSWAAWSGCPLDPKPQTIYEIQQFHSHPDDKVFVRLGDPDYVPIRRLFDPSTTGRMSSYSICLDVRTIPLTLKPMPQEGMTAAQRDQYPAPWALSCDEIDFPFCYGGWGGRGDSFISLVTPTELSQRLSIAPSSQSLTGVFLARFEDKKDWPYGKHLILVLCLSADGRYYERVGHISQGDRRVGLEVRQILERQMKRKRIEIR